VPQAHPLWVIGAALKQDSGKACHQVFGYGADGKAATQLTTDPSNKNLMFLLPAPELNDSYVFFAAANGVGIDVYEQTRFASGGHPTFQLSSRITCTDPAVPFVFCSPRCKTPVSTTLAGTSRLPQIIPTAWRSPTLALLIAFDGLRDCEFARSVRSEAFH
jgi:hypothetical protein